MANSVFGRSLFLHVAASESLAYSRVITHSLRYCIGLSSILRIQTFSIHPIVISPLNDSGIPTRSVCTDLDGGMPPLYLYWLHTSKRWRPL
jgi:hypothetical protein